ncbi:hypothetical protein ACFX11_033142 [Malus domestica]
MLSKKLMRSELPFSFSALISFFIIRHETAKDRARSPHLRQKLMSYYSHLRHHQTVELKWIFPFIFLTTLTSSDCTLLLPYYYS